MSEKDGEKDEKGEKGEGDVATSPLIDAVVECRCSTTVVFTLPSPLTTIPIVHYHPRCITDPPLGTD